MEFMMIDLNQKIKDKPYIGWLIVIGVIAVVFMLGLFASSIMERRVEALFAYKPMVEIKDFEPRNEVWGKNFPKEYESYLKTADSNFKSKYMGSYLWDMLEEDPRLVILWAGYGFSKDYKQGRGHYQAITDIRESLRTGAPTGPGTGPMPATCWTCKSPDVPRLMDEVGVEGFYSGKWADKGHEIVNAIGCADCHDNKTMKLKITRPALIEAFERMGQDISKASHQEMRSLVCAQCHVEYYFKGKNKYLTLPWDKGLSVESMEAYYDEIKFSDWTHALSKAPMLKAQHPGYEVFSTGLHARRGVSCADCHMPYRSEGGQKFTDHHIQSPLNNIAGSCQICHSETEEELKETVYSRQDAVIQNRDSLEILLVRAHIEAKFAWDKGANKDQMAPVLKLIRHAQWRWDYAAASHGGSFHSAVEVSRVIATGIEKAQEARIALTRLLATLGHNKPVPIPDINTKAKAQKYIGLDKSKLEKDKEGFLRSIVPEWIKKAEEREKN